MIVSANSTAEVDEFKLLLKNTIYTLNNEVGTSAHKIELLSGTKLERYAANIMNEHATGTPFENSIECTPGQSFPDIIAKNYYGVEVKTTIKNHWKTTGNSILESSRIASVERIFMLFGKLADPAEFKFRPYEECLSEVVVTHSPRYLIDMNLGLNETIFDKLQIPYDNLRKQTNPITSIVEYYKKSLKKGDELWWMDNVEPKTSSFIIKLWSNLTKKEQHVIRIKAFAFFPELLSNSIDKFSRLSVWLVTSQGIVCKSLRDNFSSGGRKDLVLADGLSFSKVPKMLYNLWSDATEIIKTLKATPCEELSEHWNYETNESEKVEHWIMLISQQAVSLKGINKNDVLQIIKRLPR